MLECSKVGPDFQIICFPLENLCAPMRSVLVLFPVSTPRGEFPLLNKKPNPYSFNRGERREARRNNEKKSFPSEKTLRSFANPVVEPVRAGFVIRFLELWVNPKPLVQSIRQPINCNRQTRGLCTYHNQRQTVEQNQCIITKKKRLRFLDRSRF